MSMCKRRCWIVPLECRAEGCPYLAAEGLDFCVQHDEPPCDDPEAREARERNNGPVYEPIVRHWDD